MKKITNSGPDISELLINGFSRELKTSVPYTRHLSFIYRKSLNGLFDKQ